MNLKSLTELNFKLQAAIRKEDLDSIHIHLLDMLVEHNELRARRRNEWAKAQIEEGMARCEQAFKLKEQACPQI